MTAYKVPRTIVDASVEGQLLQPAREPLMKAWGRRPDPPAITVAIAIGLARREFLVEIDAVAVVEEKEVNERRSRDHIIAEPWAFFEGIIICILIDFFYR